MALVVKDRVQETSTTTGTGTFTLAGAVTGFQSFSAIGDGNTTYYAIVGGAEWEVGLGTYTSSGTTLARNTILESSNGGTAVNFSAGTKNVFVTYPAERSVDTETPQTITNKTISPSQVSDQTNTSTGYFYLPLGTTAQRPGSPVEGMTRFNTSIGSPEWYSSITESWVKYSFVVPLSITYLVQGGGSSGAPGTNGVQFGGGGAAGILRTGSATLTAGSTYTVTVGGGGAAKTGSNTSGNVGSSSVLSGSGIATVTATGGNAPSTGTGGSNADYSGGSRSAPFAGSGAGAAGSGGNNGGIAGTSSITGSSQSYGGGGGGYDGSPGTGGGNAGTTGGAGDVNTGSGGGGGVNANATSGAGGSGVVIISIPTAQYTGTTTGSPTVTTSGSKTIIKFTSSGSYTA
jgi:hypothetical protein